jgi:O-glycosyl hydrolase
MARGKGIRAEMPGFKHYPTDTAYDWQADSAQIKIMLKIRERRPDAIFEAFSNSAPWYMTVSGCVGGHKDKNKDNLRPDCYEAFADYLIDVCKHFKDAYGLEFRTLEPFNEPLTDYWYQNGSQEGCHFDTSSQIAFIKVLYPKLKASGLSTVISASDETCLPHSLTALKAYTEAGIMPMVGQWNTHTYYGSNEEKTALRDSILSLNSNHSTLTPNLILWQSETGDGGRGIKGNLKMLQRLFDDMRYLQPAAWLDWQYYGEHDTQWCLVTGDFKSQTMYRHDNYYVRQHVTKYIKKGYTILNVDDRQTLAAISPDGKETVIVALNNSRDTVTITYNLPNSKRTITLKPWSVETLVLK